MVVRGFAMYTMQQQLRYKLNSFQASPSNFQVLHTVFPGVPSPKELAASNHVQSAATLFILDSSFNPPSIAHQSLAETALHSSSGTSYPKPHRLLLLFSTMNADKAPSAASFGQRLAMMADFANDLLARVASKSREYSTVPIDIGVTKAPYYTDKTKAIESEGLQWYSNKPKHVHLVGYDTLTRIFAPKYYASFDPPLSALDPYFDAAHELRVTLRPDDQYGSVDEQEAFLVALERGDLEEQGGKRRWSEQVRLVPPNPEVGVSSTRIRKAAKAGDWEEVKQLCTLTVAQRIQSERTYEADDSGAKMA